MNLFASSSPEEWVWLARIRRPQGRKGEVFAEILTDFPEKFAQRRHLWLLREPAGPKSRPSGSGPSEPPSPEPRQAELAAHWLHKGGIVLHFAGVDSISAAESLAGLIVAIPHSERATLPEGEVQIADLIGCTLIDVSAEPPAPIGRIENVDRSAGPVPILIVAGPTGEVLVPFAQPWLRNLDLEHQRLEMALPEGLTELNH